MERLSIFIFTVTLLLVAVSVQCFDQLKMNDEDVYECTMYVACELPLKDGKLTGFRKIISEVGPKCLEHVWKLFRNLTNSPDAGDHDEFWNSYIDKQCAYSEEDKKKMFQEFISTMADFWAEVCENNDEEECDKAEKGANTFGELISEPKARGECGSGSKNGM